MYQGESYTIVLNFMSPYDISNIQDIQLSVDNRIIGKLSDNTIFLQEGKYRCELSGYSTSNISTGNKLISVYVNDTLYGIKKWQMIHTFVQRPYNTNTYSSTNHEFNIFININMESITQTINITI